MSFPNCLFVSCSLKMHLHLFQKIYFSISILIVSLILTCIPYSSVFAQDNEQYVACNARFSCAKMEVSYPFWGSTRPEFCGHPEFELNCSGEAPVITISSLGYRVLQINSGEYLLKVARTDYWNNNCPDDPKNASLNLTFRYASDTQDLTLYYGCPGSAVATIRNQFSCPGSGTTLANYYATENMNVLNVDLQGCEETAIVRISDSAAGDLEKGSTVSQANLTAALDSGFGIEWEANNSRCEECVKSGGVCGFNLTTGEFACYCKDRPYGFMCGSDRSPSGSPSKRKYWIIGISAALSGFIILSLVLVYYRRECKSNDVLRVFWKKNRRDEFNIEAFISEHGSFAPKRYSYAQVKRMTNSFAEKIGKGGYGAVYKGKVSDGRLVAVKVLHESKTGNGEEFINEVASIGRTSHVNIVTLLGFCYERTKSALVYEYMPHGSLDKFIFNQESSSTNCHLEWKTLYEIAIGIARGLAYLHRGCNTRILHLDIKPQNILLDKDFSPKISDFGLAKLCQTKESIVSMVGARGTIGYIAPEVFSRAYGGVSHKSDVYSYGMLILEMVGGRKNFDSAASHTSQIYFPNQLFKDIEMGNEASMLENITAEEKEISRKMVLVSFWCIQPNPADRPPMSKVVDMLEGSLESIEFPPKPYLFSPTRSP